jgi:hypothetical protein
MAKENPNDSLLVTHPDLAAQAVGWDPSSVKQSYSLKLNWKCSLGHIWDTTIRHRLRNQNCPYCSSHRILQGFNDLGTSHPDLAKEADGWDPREVISAGHRKYNWKCKLGHTWQTSISNRKQGQGCPYCMGKRVLKGFNDLKTLRPEIALEADGWDPEDFTIGSGKKVSWRCKQGHSWNALIAQRVAQKTLCPYCSNYKTLPGYNDLATTHPEIAKQAHGWDPTTLVAGSGKKVSWKCSLGHITLATVESRAKKQNSCAVCMNVVVLAGFNDIATTFPEIASQAYGWNPQTLTAGSSKQVEWICSKGHIWKQTPITRTQGSGCPYCAGFYSWAGFNDLKTLNPAIADQADGWDPSTIGFGSGKKMKWKCKQGHTWESRVNNRAGDRDIGCPYCSGNQVWVGFNDLQTTHPELAKEAGGWDPKTITAGHNSKKSWVCNLGHTWKAMVSSRAFGHHGCPYCSGNLAWAGFNDLLTSDPELASEAFGWDPSTVTVSSNKKVKWKCIEGHTWTTSVAHRTVGRGCPTCAKYGFDPNLDGFFYFLRQPDWEMFQVGITNFPDQRIGKHQKSGWQVIEIRGPIEGQVSRDLETDILRMLKARGAKLSPSGIVGKFDGMTESWLQGSVRDFSSIKDLELEVNLLANEPKIDKRSAEYRRSLKPQI